MPTVARSGHMNMQATSEDNVEDILSEIAVNADGAHLAEVVFPHPGGPSKRTALGRLLPPFFRVLLATEEYTSGRNIASSRVSSISSFCSSYPTVT